MANICTISFASDGSGGTKDLRAKRQEQTDKLKNKWKVVEVYEYSLDWLRQTPFWQTHQDIFKEKKGVGYWLWKPYIILETLILRKDGDYVWYLDADLDVRIPPTDFLGFTDGRGIAAMSSGFKHGPYTKRDCALALDADSEDFHKADQVWGATLGFKNSPMIRIFVMEWLLACCNRQILCDDPSKAKEHSFFVTHRHDQAILTILMKKAGVSIIPNAWQKEPFGHPAE